MLCHFSFPERLQSYKPGSATHTGQRQKSGPILLAGATHTGQRRKPGPILLAIIKAWQVSAPGYRC